DAVGADGLAQGVALGGGEREDQVGVRGVDRHVSQGNGPAGRRGRVRRHGAAPGLVPAGTLPLSGGRTPPGKVGSGEGGKSGWGHGPPLPKATHPATGSTPAWRSNSCHINRWIGQRGSRAIGCKSPSVTGSLPRATSGRKSTCSMMSGARQHKFMI